MRQAAQARFQLVPGSGRRRARRAPDWLLTTFLTLLAVAILVAIVSAKGSERRALRRLPDAQRRGLVTQTVEELRRSCGEDQAPALRTHCRELASFAAQFDECRGECETLVRHALAPNPTR